MVLNGAGNIWDDIILRGNKGVVEVLSSQYKNTPNVKEDVLIFKDGDGTLHCLTGTNCLSIYIKDDKASSKITGIVGSPTFTNKNVEVKWVNASRTDASFMTPAVSYTITNFNNKILIPFKSLSDKFNNLFGTKFKAKIKPFKMKGEKYNDIDKNSRHYFKVLKGTINSGISIKNEDEDEPKSLLVYPPFLKILNIATVSQVGIYFAPKVEFNLVGGRLTNTIGETNKILKDEFFVEANVMGCIEIGLVAELLVAKELIDFSVKGYGEGCVSGKVNYNVSTNEFVGGFYFDPLKLGVKAKIKTKSENFKFTLVDIDKTWTITDKNIIYESMSFS